MPRLIGVYGSLRKGGSNHPMLHPDGAAEPVAVVAIPGHLYSLGDYCCAVPLSDGEHGTIVAEIYEVDDETFRALDAMEREYGYIGIDTTAADASGGRHTFVVWYHPDPPASAVRIPEGDWPAYCRSVNQSY